jgi:hypothetical protein
MTKNIIKVEINLHLIEIRHLIDGFNSKEFINVQNLLTFVFMKSHI